LGDAGYWAERANGIAQTLGVTSKSGQRAILMVVMSTPEVNHDLEALLLLEYVEADSELKAKYEAGKLRMGSRFAVWINNAKDRYQRHAGTQQTPIEDIENDPEWGRLESAK